MPSRCWASTYYQPTAGSISIGGVDIRHMAANELRAHFKVVPQETVPFSGTIYANLTATNPGVRFEQVVPACKMSGVHDVMEALSQGYQTEVGERGAGSSGGQKRRPAIARALLKGPKVLIFEKPRPPSMQRRRSASPARSTASTVRRGGAGSQCE